MLTAYIPWLLIKSNQLVNRDYTFVYNCYIRARKDMSIRYMKRLKKYWDEIHLELNFFTERQLHQQSTFAEKKKLVLQSNQDSVNSEQLESHDGSNVINNIDEDNHLP